jgi:hypothetical protein
LLRVRDVALDGCRCAEQQKRQFLLVVRRVEILSRLLVIDNVYKIDTYQLDRYREDNEHRHNNTLSNHRRKKQRGGPTHPTV